MVIIKVRQTSACYEANIAFDIEKFLYVELGCVDHIIYSVQ
jgi:hypothetical protein